MAEASSSSLAMPKEKPVVVRVKRKANQMPLDALWLEIHERQPKRTILDVANISFTGAVDKKKGSSKARRVLVQHVETVECSEATKCLLERCLENSSDPKGSKQKIQERRSLFKKEKRQDLLYSTARQKHEELARSARFEQIWRSRRLDEKDDDLVSEIYHLYNVMRVDDDEEEKYDNEQVTEDAPNEEDGILCNYLPLIREYLPTAAEEIESDINGRASNGDTYVYDIYTMEGILELEDQAMTGYPLVQVNAEDLCRDDWGSDYETDDSNAENNPMYDYPDEESSEDGDVFLNEEVEYEKDIAGTSEEENGKDDLDWRWGYR